MEKSVEETVRQIVDEHIEQQKKAGVEVKRNEVLKGSVWVIETK